MPSSDPHRARRDRLRLLLDSSRDGLLVTSLTDLRYLTGFSGSNGALFVAAAGTEGDILSTDTRYVEQAAQQCPDLGVLIARTCAEAVAEQVIAQGGSHIAVDRRMSVVTLDALRKTGILADPIESPVESLRLVKDSEEIAALAEACAITSQAVDILAAEIRVGVTEVALARRLEQLFGELGADDRAFPTIVAAGESSAEPHHEPGSRRLSAGDLLVIDSGALVRGYHADMTRTFVVGAPAQWQVDLHDVVDRAASAAREAVRPGVLISELDGVARDLIAEAGFAEHFGHGLGHGTGLDIHEAPMIGPRAEGRLTADTTITVEPGVYLPGRGGVRIEDSLLVTADGHRSLTSSPRDLRIVG